MTSLYEAAKRFFNVTMGDPEITIGAPTAAKRDAIDEAGDCLREVLLGANSEDMRAVCEALGFDPTNHHNAAKCPYCRPAAPQEQPAPPLLGWKIKRLDEGPFKLINVTAPNDPLVADMYAMPPPT